MRYRSYRGPSFTPLWVIIAINIVFYLATFIAPGLRLFLGLPPTAFWDRPWTILTSLFIHGGLWHVMANMLTLFFFGRYLYALIGERRFLTVYFAGGILGNILLLLLVPFFSFFVAYGASGAVFAVAGTLAVMRPKTRVFIFPIPVPLPLWVAVIGGFLVLTLIPHIAWQAHLGGLMVGLVSGYFFRKRERSFF